MGWESPSHWVIIAILVIALFGYKKLPDAARSIGRSLRIFKTEVKGMSEDDKKRAEAKKAGDAPKAIEARVVEADGGLSHTVAETAPRPRPRPTPGP
jgi:sec-independent protein translocase protein TatA